MQTLHDLLTNQEKSDARSALYYLSRFLKQAAHFKNYRKDIFNDDFRSAPSEATKNATKRMIEFIEGAEGMPITEFNGDTYNRWAKQVRALENSLDPQPTESDLARAQDFLKAFDLPDSK